MKIIPALRRLRQENLEFEASPDYTEFKTSLGYIARTYLKKKKRKRLS
jgi:hypothetical protein